MTDWRRWYGQHVHFTATTGTEWTARCPFHDDGERPSFRVNVAEGLWFDNHDRQGGTARQFARRLGVPPPSGNGTRPRPRIVARYEYRDEQGRLLFRVVRTSPKGFWQERPDGDGGWIRNIDGVRRVLYRLPELAAGEDPVFVAEGEKDVDRLRSLGLTATTNPMGANTWEDEYSESLRGRAVVLLPDNDTAGREHMRAVARSVDGIAASVRWLALEGLPEKGDVTDWLDAGGTAADLRQLAADAPAPPQDPSATTGEPAEEAFHKTDLGNAQRLVAQHGADLHFCHPWRQWMAWDGARWVKDDTAEVYRRAKETVRSIYGEAEQESDDAHRNALVRHALASERDARIKAMLSLAQSEPSIPILPDQFDQDIWLLNVRNGTLDTRSGVLRPHRREDLLTKLAPVEYHAEAACPRWLAFLGDIFDGNQDLIGFTQRAVGAGLTGDTSDQVIYILHGGGANGKTTFVRTIQGVLGDYAMQAPAETFLAKRGTTIPNDVARLRGARFAACMETEEDRRLAEGLVKQSSGGDRVAARFLYSEFFEFTPQFKLWIATNHRPVIKGTDHAIWRRVRLIPFEVQIPEENQVPDYHATLLAEEAAGILAWAVAGNIERLQTGLNTPEIVRTATQGYRSDMDTLAAFLDECCELGAELRVTVAALYDRYSQWARESGEQAMSKKALGTRLGERGFLRGREGSARTWHGLRLRANASAPGDDA